MTQVDCTWAESWAKLRKTGGRATQRPARSPAISPAIRRATLQAAHTHRRAAVTADMRSTKPDPPASQKPAAET